MASEKNPERRQSSDGTGKGAGERRKRLAGKLRENLKKRKRQTRARASMDGKMETK